MRVNAQRPTSRALVAFDLDDTLYPEYAYAEGALRTGGEFLERRLGLPGIASLAQELLRGAPAPEPPLQRAAHLVAGSAADEWIPAAIQVLTTCLPPLEPFPDVLPVLQSLAPRCLLALVSDGRSDTQRGKLRALGLTSFFSHVIVSEDFPGKQGKLTGAPYRALLAATDDARPRFMIGDQLAKDVTASERFGFVGFLVRRHSVRYVHADQPQHHCYSNLREVLSALDALLSV